MSKMRFTLVLLSFLFIKLSFSQTAVPNGGFENWQNVGSATEEPTNWNSNKTGGGFASYGPQTCFRNAADYHSGSYSVRILTGSALGNTVNGTCTSGKIEAPTTSRADGYIHTIAGDPNFSSPFSGRPDSLVGWYKYTSVSGDYGKVQVLLHKGNQYNPETPSNSNHPDSTINTIARATFSTPASNVTVWTRFSVPFVYVNGQTPQYFFGLLTSTGSQSGGASGSELLVDDLDVIYNPTIATGGVSPLTYYVSATNSSAVSVPFTLTGTITAGNVVTAQLSDASGSFASPVTIGTMTTTTSGTIVCTIPAGTATGSGYRIRVVSSTPALTAADNGSNIQINLCSNSVAPTTAQTIAANTNGTTLTVTETPAATSRQWLYSSTSGGPYTNVISGQTGTNYPPAFATAGTYYVVCKSTFGSLNLTTNEVMITVESSVISPSTSQSILVSTNGNQLTVTETPAGSSRVWMYSTTTGGPYSSTAPGQTGASTYTPNFSSIGNYYLVCVSTINSISVTSNEVLISVGNVTITTGTIAGSPFNFSASSTNPNVSVPFTATGTYLGGNVFTAQLSDSNGSFATPTVLGTLNGTVSGAVFATLNHTTPSGIHYRIRVVSSNPAVIGSDNGVDIIIDQFRNLVAPSATQTIMANTNGNVLTVTESQTATRNWKYSTTSGSGYVNFGVPVTTNTYTPNFSGAGTYYVVCESKNAANDIVRSNEVQIVVQNGTYFHTLNVSGSPFLLSPHANVQIPVSFSTDMTFGAGNQFNAQLSDAAGSFAAPVVIGTVSSTVPAAINSLIPVNTPNGSGYRIRVVSTNPVSTATVDSTDLQVIQFAANISPTATQNIDTNQNGTALTVAETHPAHRQWMVSTTSLSGYHPVSPADTGASYTPLFPTANTYYVVAKSVNSWNDTITTNQVTVNVRVVISIQEVGNSSFKAFLNNEALIVDLTQSQMKNPTVQLFNINGQEIVNETLVSGTINSIHTVLPVGVYFFRIMDNNMVYSGKVVQRGF